jgi:hypothetical protein
VKSYVGSPGLCIHNCFSNQHPYICEIHWWQMFLNWNTEMFKSLKGLQIYWPPKIAINDNRNR